MADLQARPGQTERAARELLNQGYEVFSPDIRLEKLRGGKRIECIEPLFPGYVFIELSELESNWRPIRSTRGVARLVTFGTKPAVVPDEVVEQLRKRRHASAADAPLRPDQSVRIEEGPFQHLDAVFVEYDGDKRAILLLQLLGQWQPLSVPLDSIRPL